jgi:site-specific DNA-cytosine methylase
MVLFANRRVRVMTLRALEFFCGIGGFAAAVAGWNVEVAGAFDQSAAALAVYRLNFPAHDARQYDLERLTSDEVMIYGADLWWLSPPCQPYCIRGTRGDLDDPRARSLARLLDLIASLPAEHLPRHLALENVTGFAHSQARSRFLHLLTGRGYRFHERFLCPTELGVPSRRPRYYLAASREKLSPPGSSLPPPLRPLSAYVDPHLTAACPAELRIADDLLDRFGSGFRILDPAAPESYTTCFTAGYGKSLMHAGAYLRCTDGVRRFAPEEIARLLHFPAGFRFPEGMPLRKQWHLVGNSLSVAAVREVLRAFPDLKPPPASMEMT